MAYISKSYLDTLYQPLDSDLTTLAGLTATTDNFIVSVASAWASRTPSQVRTTLGLVIGTNVQAWDADLDTWAGITPASGIGTFLATPSSVNLKAAITDETGSGALVFADTPTLVTPILGVASATSLSIGTLTYSPSNPLITSQSSVNAFNQIIIQNSSNGAAASSDLIVNNDQSTDTTFYGDFGMNSSGFTGSGSLNQPNYVFITSTSTDLVIGTTTAHGIHFTVNNGTTDAMSISSSGVTTIANLVNSYNFSGGYL